MNIYVFDQSNDFGDTISMTLTARDKQHALEMIREFIIDNTDSYDKTYKSKYESMKITFEYEIKQTNYDKKFYIGKKHYSVADYMENKHKVLDEFATDEARDTYVWFFDNKPYNLTKHETRNSAIISYDFIYCGR